MALYNENLRPFKKIIITSDNSNTLYSSEFDECYHSTKDGALNESLSKHIIPAFDLLTKKDKIAILDICFGLGYNTLATIHYCKKNNIKTKIEIISPELDLELVKSLKDFSYPKEFDELLFIVEELSEKQYYEDEQFKIKVLIGDARETLKYINKKFDIVYQDAFSPKKNPLLWTKEYFENIKDLSSEDVILTTYSTATPVRMSLYECGFKLYDPESDKVRSGTIASLNELNLTPIDMELKKARNPEAKSLMDDEFKTL
jgi:tRNA U34 5-methylaminomethyl-2-thiouridine-forming methyltransferase MnmC